MSSFNCRITAWDCMAEVWWTVKIWDFDADEENGESASYTLTGAMPGQGSEHPTKWLRELLEALREAM